jgi:hypothetical protein
MLKGLDIENFHMMMIMDDVDSEEYSLRSLQKHLALFVNNNQEDKLSVDDLMRTYDLVTPKQFPFTTHGFGNSPDIIKVQNSLIEIDAGSQAVYDCHYVFARIAIRDGALAYSDKAQAENPMAKLKACMLKMKQKNVKMEDANPA